MEFLVVVLIVLILFVVISKSTRIINMIAEMANTIGILQKQVASLKKDIAAIRKDDATSLPGRWAAEEKTTSAPADPTEILPTSVESEKTTENIATPTPDMDRWQKRSDVPLLDKPAEHVEPFSPKEFQSAPVEQPRRPTEQSKESWFDKWVRNNPDLEKFIGENLISKIGIAVLVLGIAFFVKYAIDKNWINETGRVCIGLFCGATLIALAHYMRNTYRSFSSVLAGGGIAVFYFTIAFAFHEYNLLPQSVAFIIMLVITTFAVALSILYDKIELAVIALVGGFIAPFLVSTGQGNYIVLFNYLTILNLGLLSLAFFKRWRLVNFLALFFTEIIYAAWLIRTVNDLSVKVDHMIALLFATVFYVIFISMNVIYQISKKQAFKAFDYFILLFITGTYFTAGMVLLHYVQNGAYQGAFTAVIGIFNFTLAYYFFKIKATDKNLLYLLIGLTLSFISLAVPVQLHGHAITMFWSAEFVLLYWLYTRSQISIFKRSAMLVSLLTIISLIMDWNNAQMHTTSHLVVMYNDIQGVVTNIIAVAAFALFSRLVHKQKEEDYIRRLSSGIVQRVAMIVSIAILFFTCIYGVNLLLGQLNSYEVPNVYHRLITETFAVVLFLLLQKQGKASSMWLRVAIVAVCFLVYLFSSGLVTDLLYDILYGTTLPTSRNHIYVHGLDMVLLLFLLYRAITMVHQRPEVFAPYYKPIAWTASIALIILFSIEVAHVYVMVCYSNLTISSANIHAILQQYGKAGLTIVWAVCSFALMWLGMRYRYKTTRIISLSLFFVALAKLFVFDLRNISPGGKIAAFILLGVLLLTVSFMYQKLKKIIIDDNKQQ